MAADPLDSDELLLLKKRARRRLVGAVAFMIVALVVLSSVMETRPAPEQKPAPVAIDGLAGAPAAPATNPFVTPADASAATASAEPDRAVPSPVLAPLETRPAVAANPAAAAGAPAVKPGKKPAATASDGTTPVRAADKKPAKPPVDTSKAAKPARPAADSDKPATANARLSSSLVALSDEGRAGELLRKLKAQGVRAYTEKVTVNGKTLTRVRVGPYATREELDKARARAALLGL